MCKSPAADVLELFLNSLFGAHNPLRALGEVSAPSAAKVLYRSGRGVRAAGHIEMRLAGAARFTFCVSLSGHIFP